MDNTIILILLVILIVLAATCLMLIVKKSSEISKNVSDEFKDFRMQEINHREAISDKLSTMTKQNYESQLAMGDRISRSLFDIRESNEKKLDEMRQTVDEKLTSTLTTRLNSSFKTVSEQLENVYKSLGEMKTLSEGVTTNVTNLNRVLTNVKARGTWAEVQLEGILNQTIPNMYDKNVATNPNSLARVEFAVKIPSADGAADSKEGIIYLPIDSKFPMEDYIRLCDAADAADAEGVAQARKALEDRVKLEAKAITQYINEPLTTPFAIMYLATEGLYAEIASSRSGLPERLQSEYNVMIAGPSTITALLNSLSMGFRAVAINEKAKEVRELLSITKSQYEIFGGVLEKARKKIDEAGRTLDDAQHRNSIIRKKLKSVEEIEPLRAEELLNDSDYIS